MIDDLWSIDHKVLVEMVRQIEIEGADYADSTEARAQSMPTHGLGANTTCR